MLETTIAYFSMEIGLSHRMPTYSGGLGVLAGDTLRAAADWGLPLAAVTLIHRNGYFRQRIDESGQQLEEPDAWNVADHLTEMQPRVQVEIEGQTVVLRGWLAVIEGILGHKIPVYFLDSDLEENTEEQRRLTDVLYGGDHQHRLCQEIILGIGGLRFLRAMGHDGLDTYHMNEGHSSLLTLELMQLAASRAGRKVPSASDVSHVKNHCVFTTHTPVAAGHDRFPKELFERLLPKELFQHVAQIFPGDVVNMTELALLHSRYVNGVARRHGEVARGMFGGYDVSAITNGVHAATWAAPSIARLFDRHVPGWREDNQSLRYMSAVPLEELGEAHRMAKQDLLSVVKESLGVELDEHVITIGFARRATAYKRADLVFRDVERLNEIAEKAGPMQFVYAGKAHPRDERGKAIIQRVLAVREKLSPKIRLVYLENYNMRLGALLTAGSDLWLNTPEAPKEASGTSGMKAALNGVPSLSILDGWWIEGHIEGVTGWSIGKTSKLSSEPDGEADVASLYDKLERVILPLFYRDLSRYMEVARHAIALNGSFFNTERMVSEYARQAYRLSREV
ncbi:MAG TPA: alpha-glucan family phosphorylase [Vicinamibacteria bacterium]|nr:alpha-glucan family phosphorylase [Vicinamibacteria bacterium]